MHRIGTSIKITHPLVVGGELMAWLECLIVFMLFNGRSLRGEGESQREYPAESHSSGRFVTSGLESRCWSEARRLVCLPQWTVCRGGGGVFIVLCRLWCSVLCRVVCVSVSCETILSHERNNYGQLLRRYYCHYKDKLPKERERGENTISCLSFTQVTQDRSIAK